jgi:replication initiation protein RepC
MEYTPISPFMRQVSHAHLRLVEARDAPAMSRPVNKWHLLRELAKAQAAFGVTERDLTVLQGLLSFFPDDKLGGNAEMVVFPSNRAICERLNGMPCSTMRRHLGRLVEAGLLVRRDSPNGKRYARRDGDDRVSFGFDLSVLHRRSEEIARAAEAVREAEGRIRRLRETVSLMRRDVAALAVFGEDMHPGLGLWDQLRDAAALAARALRRKLSAEELTELRSGLGVLLDLARDRMEGSEAEGLSTSGACSGQHHYDSRPESIDLEHAVKQGKATGPSRDDDNALVEAEVIQEAREGPRIPLHLVTASCRSIGTIYQGPIRHWHQLHAAACNVRPALGISASAWEEAQRVMGPEQASVVIVAMLERFADIRSPGGYLRALTARAAAGRFSCGPMVMALIGRRGAA